MKNYLKNIIRDVINNPLYSFINLAGLIIGITSVILIFLWVGYELGYDRFHEKENRIYKISQENSFSTVPPLFNYIKKEFPDIEAMVRITSDAEGYINPNGENNTIKTNNILYASPEFNDIFTVQKITGDIESGLSEPNSIILSEQVAKKIFGETNVEGRVINYKSNFPVRELTLVVKSVVNNFPDNSTLKFDAIIPFNTLNNLMPNGMKPDDNWRDGYCNMYVLLKDGVDSKLFEDKLAEYGSGLEKIVYNIDPESTRAQERKLGIVSMDELHFYKNNRSQLVGYISITGILILLIALVNYINLSVAKLFAGHQAIYIRKINGASRFQLIKTILSESILFSIIAFILSLITIKTGEPLLTKMLHIDLNFGFSGKPLLLPLLFLSVLLIGIITGLHPAIKLTSNTHVNISQANFIKKEHHFVRQALVIFQFAVSIALITSIIVISKQLNYVTTKNLGFNSQQVLYTQLNKNLYGTYDTFKDELLKNPNIQSVSGSQNELGQVCVTLTRKINGKDRYFQELPVDPDFIKTMGLEIVQGRNFSLEMQTDAYQTVILNETAVKEFELDNADIIGTEIFMYDRIAKVIGVVKDFYFQSFHHQLDPFMLYYHPGSIGTANIKLSSANISETINYINQIWSEFSPDIPFEYHFLDKTYEDLYSQEKLFGKIIFVFLLIAVVIACLGLFGLVSFTTFQSTKEIGIRKVNGAKIWEVMALLNKDFVKWVAIAFVIATPIAYYAMHKWLQNFAYKTELSWWIFALAGLLALGIALLTVSWQSWRAATRNPVEALRYE